MPLARPLEVQRRASYSGSIQEEVVFSGTGSNLHSALVNIGRTELRPKKCTTSVSSGRQGCGFPIVPLSIPDGILPHITRKSSINRNCLLILPVPLYSLPF